jgi:hypothetical protein
VKNLAHGRQGLPYLCQVIIDLCACEGLHDDGALQPQLEPQGVVLRDSATDGQGQQAVVLPKGIDRLDTGRPVLGLDFS